MDDMISRQAAIDRATKEHDFFRGAVTVSDKARRDELLNVMCWLGELPPAQPERDTPKRVMWTGWKGHRYTRYSCPNCKKPVRNDDVYCHRCGQRLMFPKVSHTPYVEGQKQEVIVIWEDEVTE